MHSEDVFTIVRDCRKKKIVKHRHRRQVPPIAVETRRMSNLKVQISESSSYPYDQEIEQDFEVKEEPSMQNIIEYEINHEMEPKIESPESTPFGIGSG